MSALGSIKLRDEFVLISSDKELRVPGLFFFKTIWSTLVTSQMTFRSAMKIGSLS